MDDWADARERKRKMTNNPKTINDLPSDVKFFDVNGLPVAIADDVEAWAFDVSPARAFDLTSVMHDGVEIGRVEFTKLLPS
jgi:hypothetical protein